MAIAITTTLSWKENIKGAVLEDTNNDNSGDNGVCGVVIKLCNENGDIFGTTSTRGNGNNNNFVVKGEREFVLRVLSVKIPTTMTEAKKESEEPL